MDFYSRYKYNPKTDMIGKGGFSKVFKAHDTLLDRYVALKFFTAEVSEKYHVLNEIKKVINFDHPHLCKYYDVVLLEGRNLIGETERTEVGVMEYLSGNDLKTYTRSNPQHLNELLVQVLKGLSYLHRKNIIHRDLKPQNVLIKLDDDEPIAKITDFGISKALGSDGNSSSALLGTIEYMAPEQFNPQKYGVNGQIGTNLDLWSFGLLVYELVSGTSLFGNRGAISAEQVMSNILSSESFQKLHNLPEPYKSVVERCLVKEAAQRVQKADELIPILQHGAQQSHQPAKPQAIQPAASGNETKVLPKEQPMDAGETRILPKEEKPAPKPVEIKKPAAPAPINTAVKKKNKWLVPSIAAVIVIALMGTGYVGWNKGWFSLEKKGRLAEIDKIAAIAYENMSYGSLRPLYYSYLQQNNYSAKDSAYVVERLVEAERLSVVRDSSVAEVYRSGKYNEVFGASSNLIRVKLDGKYGFTDMAGNLSIPNKFDEAQDFVNGFAIVQEKLKKGFIDRAGTTLGKIEYDNVKDFSGNHAAVMLKRKWGMIDSTGKLVVPCEYDEIGDMHMNRVVTAKDGKYGVIDATNKEVIPFTYNFIVSFLPYANLFAVNNSSKFGFATMDGKVGELLYNELSDFGSESTGIIVTKDGKQGLVDLEGKVVIKPEYDKVLTTASHGYAVVKNGDKFGFVKTGEENKLLTEIKYDEAYAFSCGLAPFRTGKKWGFINLQGQEVIQAEYDNVTSFSFPGYATVEKDGEVAAIDKNNKFVIPLEYKELNYTYSFENNNPYWEAQNLNSEFGLIDKTNKAILEFKYRDIEYIANGLIKASHSYTYDENYNSISNIDIYKLDGRRVADNVTAFYFVSTDGLLFYANDEAKAFDVYRLRDKKFNFKQLLSKVGCNWIARNSSNEIIFVNGNGDEVDPKVDDLKDYEGFKEGLVVAKRGNNYGVVDTKGYEVIPFEYYDLGEFSNNRAWADKSGFFGYIDRENKQIKNFSGAGASLWSYKNFFANVKKNGKVHLYDMDGNEVSEIEPSDDYITVIPGIGFNITRGEFAEIVDFDGKTLVDSKARVNGSFAEEGSLLVGGEYYGAKKLFDLNGRLMIEEADMYYTSYFSRWDYYSNQVKIYSKVEDDNSEKYFNRYGNLVFTRGKKYDIMESYSYVNRNFYSNYSSSDTMSSVDSIAK